jgi:hypothetical protein
MLSLICIRFQLLKTSFVLMQINSDFRCLREDMREPEILWSLQTRPD